MQMVEKVAKGGELRTLRPRINPRAEGMANTQDNAWRNIASLLSNKPFMVILPRVGYQQLVRELDTTRNDSQR